MVIKTDNLADVVTYYQQFMKIIRGLWLDVYMSISHACLSLQFLLFEDFYVTWQICDYQLRHKIVKLVWDDIQEPKAWKTNPEVVMTSIQTVALTSWKE